LAATFRAETVRLRRIRGRDRRTASVCGLAGCAGGYCGGGPSAARRVFGLGGWPAAIPAGRAGPGQRRGPASPWIPWLPPLSSAGPATL